MQLYLDKICCGFFCVENKFIYYIKGVVHVFFLFYDDITSCNPYY